MVGFESYDANGVLQLTSDMKSILVNKAQVLNLYSDSSPVFWLTDGVSLLSGVANRLNRLYGMRQGSTIYKADPTKSYWVNIPDGGAFTRVGDNFGGNAGTCKVLEGTNRLLNHISGYLDVYDQNGLLTWSAASAGSVPMVAGVFSATRNQLWDRVGGASITIPGEPYFFANSLIGWAQIPESGISETHGVSIFRSGNTYYMFADFYSSFASYAQAKAAFSPAGVNVPFATLL